ncbi:DICT sensory domain-containing protein [Halocalculus aciditolerans]|uniref:DICT domain-containing protein n=1 Tax=Halocalculus aciditolerans TaxID=1383812 RepID=A0A830FJC5_9EURY|nr:DICT sensory domain-containing protein [Halocalculus aciditolerans]GGL60852.1 hypothetical protein GCM10009039_18850 [Halocalculus aciditolerans]
MRPGLRDVIDAVRARERTLTVYASDASLADALRAHFASQNVRVRHEPLESGVPRVEVSERGRVRATVDASSVSDFVADDPPLKRVGEDVAYREILEAVDDATFTACDVDAMLHASREIEDRAWRADRGTLAAGFQFPAAFEAQRHTYEVLASGGLDVHVFVPGGLDDPVDEVTVHEAAARRVDPWFVLYDGGGERPQKSALLAEEGVLGQFYGVLTYDPGLVDDAFAALDLPHG